MRRAIVVAIAVSSASPAVADEPSPTHVRARLDGDVARFTLRYPITASETAAGNLAVLELPEHGLVTAATVIEGGKRRPLALVPAEQASASYDALFEKGDGPAPTRAVMIDAIRDAQVRISAALPDGAKLIVETEVAVPTCYARDARYVAVPAEWSPLIKANVRRAAADAAPCGTSTDDDRQWIGFPVSRGGRMPAADRVRAYAGRATLGSADLVKLELDLAGKLSEVPADLVTAIVVDTSRSMTPADLAAQRDAIAAYLRAVPHSRVQLIAYARRARALLPAWMVAKEVAGRVDRELQALRLENGSSVEAGLREAARWLGTTRGTRRIVLFTDELLAARTLHTRVADEAVPAGTLVHVVAVGGEGFERDDGAVLARLAKRTRGLSVRGGAKPEDAELDATLLARPITLDHVVVHTPGFTAFESRVTTCTDERASEPATLAEGEACTWWGQGAGAAPFSVEGLLWNERVVRVVYPDRGRALDLVREVSMLDILDEELQALADRAARAVNEVWSLWTAWGGDDGYDAGFGFGTSGGFTCSTSCRAGLVGGSGTLGFAVTRPDLAAAYRRIVRTACAPREPVTLEVETTLEEIVEVTVDARDPQLRECATEALWNATLVAPHAPLHEVTTVTL